MPALTHEQLRKLAARKPPPESWWEEDLGDLLGEGEVSDPYRLITVTVLDTKTGQTATCSAHTAWFWAESNGSCDCNRAPLFPGAVAEVYREKEPHRWYATGESFCFGSERFLITAADTTDFSLRELNYDYPAELLAQHLPQESKP